MAGRFPFDPNNPNGNPGRVTNAQMRAALGLPSVDELSAGLYVEQQQRLEAQQRDLRYRQALYQDQLQLDHQLQELQLRANAAAELEQMPDLQQHYANLLLKERIARGQATAAEIAAAEQQAQQQAVGPPTSHHQQQQQAVAAAYRARAAAAAQQEQQQYAAAAAAGHAAAAAAAHPASVQAAAAAQELRRYHEELRQKQQQTAALQAHLQQRGAAGAASAAAAAVAAGGLDQLVIRNTGSNASVAAAAAATPTPTTSMAVAAAAVGSPQVAAMAAAGVPPAEVPEAAAAAAVEPPNLSRHSSVDSVELEDLVIEQHKKQRPELLPSQTGGGGEAKEKTRKRRRANSAADPNAAAAAGAANNAAGAAEKPVKRRRGRPRKNANADGGAKSSKKGAQSGKERVVDEEDQRMRAEAILQAMADRAAGLQRYDEPDNSGRVEEDDRHELMMRGEDSGKMEARREARNEANQQGARGASPMMTLGTVEGLLMAATSEEKAFDVAHVLQGLKGAEWVDDDEKDEGKSKTAGDEKKALSVLLQQQDGLPVPQEPLESVVTSMIESHFPRLPEEPLHDGITEQVETLDHLGGMGSSHSANLDVTDHDKTQNSDEREDDEKTSDDEAKKADPDNEQVVVKKSNVLDYPYPVDTWWPSTAGRRRERRHGGEESDEDAFEEPARPASSDAPLFRANEEQIRERLQTELEPGVLEKLPHCRLHRMKRRNSPLTELVYCFQVTECYPNDVMVCCSICGTWRHAACGGHFEPYSIRKNVGKPFVAICEQCHEEKQYTKDYPLAQARLERQRVEQLRRGLATTAVMRSMSFSKHGGTYKWPLGSVSATHVGGHTRSVQARHDKAEKQWADLLTRLGRGYGYRTKERQRIRTKELERLLVAIEDAEGQTDRHNMLLFLMRDTKKPVPCGFEEEHKNLFDPSYTEEEFDSLGYTPTSRRPESQRQTNAAAAAGDGDDKVDGAVEANEKVSRTCYRQGCKKKARFDSKFCSDGCGVHVLELDLLDAFYESNEIHPSVLRSHY